MTSGKYSDRSAAGDFEPPLSCEYFDVYRPGGRVRLVPLIALPLWTALVGSGLAWAYAWFNYSGYVLSGSRLLGSLIAWSLLTGWLAMKGVKWFKLGRPGPAMVLAAFGALLGWAASWPAVYYFTGSSLSGLDFFIQHHADGIVVDIDNIFRQGGSAGPDYRLFQGPYLLCWWLLEAAFYSLLVGRLAAGQAGRPFSATSRRWYTKISPRTLKLDRADLKTLVGLPRCEVPDFLVNLDKYTLTRRPRFLLGSWLRIALFQDPDWQRPFISVQFPCRRLARYKLRYYRITQEEADILTEKFK